MPPPDLFQAGVGAHQRGDLAQAEQLYRRTLEIDPRSVDCHLNLGILLRTVGRPREARPILESGLALAPDHASLKWALGLTLLMLGDYRAGWPLYEIRRGIFKVAAPDLPVPEWKGEPLAGKRIAVFPEQGLGDAIQFARFLPLLRSQGARVLLLCKPPLAPLFDQAAFEGVEVRALAGQVDLGEIDFWVSMLSLPYRLGVTLETLPAAPYLPAPEPERGTRPRIGVVTAGNPRHDNDGRRSLDAGAAQRLRQLPGAEIVSLDPADTGARDFAQTARIVAGLDLVISVDTAAAHLAGAMGKRTFLLLPGLGVDWRWMAERDDSPWYPNHRLFRCGIDGDWGPVLDRVSQAVARL